MYTCRRLILFLALTTFISPMSGQGTRSVRNDTTVLLTKGNGTWGASRTATEVRRVGGGSSGPSALGNPMAVTALRDGGVVFLDDKAVEGAAIRLFDSTGRFVRNIGRVGAGPGEFQPPVSLAAATDGRIWVADPLNARVSIFAPDGRFLRQIRVPSGSWSLNMLQLGPRGDFFLTQLRPDRSASGGSMAMRRIFIHFDSLGRAIDTVVGGSIRGPGSAVATDGTLGMASEETVRILLRPNLPQSRILAAALDRPRAAYLPEERKSNAKVNSTFGDEVASGRGSILPTGNFKRPFTALLSDGENRIWARRSVSSVKETSLRSATNPMGIREPFVFDAFQTNGTFLGEVTFPALAPSLRISFAGSTAWAVVNGADDEPFLVRFRFR